MAGLTLSGPDKPALVPEGHEGQSEEARKASSLKLGPGGAPRLLVSSIDGHCIPTRSCVVQNRHCDGQIKLSESSLASPHTLTFRICIEFNF